MIVSGDAATDSVELKSARVENNEAVKNQSHSPVPEPPVHEQEQPRGPLDGELERPRRRRVRRAEAAASLAVRDDRRRVDVDEGGAVVVMMMTAAASRRRRRSVVVSHARPVCILIFLLVKAPSQGHGEQEAIVRCPISKNLASG